MEEVKSHIIGKGVTDRYLTEIEIAEIVRQSLDSINLNGKRVLIIIPDGTRTMPMPLMFKYFQSHLLHRTRAVDYLVALGTHKPMSDEHLSRLLGQVVSKGQVGSSNIYNHQWNDPKTFVKLGTIPSSEIEQLSGGLLAQDVRVEINRLVLDYDHILICGPVFPHEVVGFSGGNKYFFPGIAGPEIIHLTHWFGALLSNYKVNGAGYTPVRAVIDRAASLIQCPVSCFALVVTHEGLHGLYFGNPQEAWQSASHLSAQKHIIYVERPYKKVISVMPTMYDDLWTAAKGMYKVEPAVEDGGEVIIYAPHISEISYTHGKILDEIGYHCRDYFLAHWERFKQYPGGVLAHSTHLKGLGTYNVATGEETPRIQVTLATGISAERCRNVNLGYLNPEAINPWDWQNREGEGVLVVPRAGEMLYRVRQS